MECRLAGPDDLPGIVAINTWAIENTPANFALEPESLESWVESFEQTRAMFPWYVADIDSTVAGFSKAAPWKGRCAYQYAVESTVYVHPDHHGRGVGRALYSRLLDTLRAQGYHTALGGITQPNPASVALHESLGMKRVAMFENIGWKFDRWHDVGYWQATLQNDPAPGSVRPVRDVVD